MKGSHLLGIVKTVNWKKSRSSFCMYSLRVFTILSCFLQSSIMKAIREGGGLADMTGNNVKEAALLLSGLPGDIVSEASRELTLDGIERERIMFCEYF